MNSPDPDAPNVPTPEVTAIDAAASRFEHPPRPAARLADSTTHALLVDAVAAAGVSQLRALWFAQQADVDGRPELARRLRSVADDLTSNAFGLIEFLAEVGDPVTGGPIGEADDNVAASIESEVFDRDVRYPGNAATARAEGFGEIAAWFDALADAAERHGAKLSEPDGDS